MIFGDIIVVRFDWSYCGLILLNVEFMKWDIYFGYFLEVIVCVEFYFIIFFCVYENIFFLKIGVRGIINEVWFCGGW